MIQLTIIKITEYGPWTLTLGSDREHELQMLQAHLYGQIQKLFSEKNCLVFSNRFDEFFVITNGLTLADHVEISRAHLELGILSVHLKREVPEQLKPKTIAITYKE